jgi:hypothetical protein
MLAQIIAQELGEVATRPEAEQRRLGGNAQPRLLASISRFAREKRVGGDPRRDAMNGHAHAGGRRRAGGANEPRKPGDRSDTRVNQGRSSSARHRLR